jgi:SNF2 family DNA or RNA helicase
MSSQKATSISTEMMMPHQQRIVDKLKKDDQEGLILMHGLGSGKTRSSIEAYKALGLPTEVIAPAALKENYSKEIKKWVGKQPKDIHIRSQQEVSRKGLGGDDLSNKLMILDEAHRMRNDASKLYSALSEAHPKKRVLLSGTPIYNHPGDIATLVNIAAGKRLMPEDRKAFEQRYINRREIPVSIMYRMMGMRPGEHVSLKNTEELKRIFSKYVDYHAGNSEGFPSLKTETVNVPLAAQQEEIYNSLMKKIPWVLRKKIEMGLAPNKRELDKLVPFLTGARMISNSTNEFVKDPATAVSPKINKAFSYLQEQMLKDKNYKALIYSNYLRSGVEPYKKLLTEANIPYGEFTGEIKDSVRNKLIQDYNANKIRALIVSSAGGEGLDLKGTRLVQLLEPHFNNEKLKQVIGRAARYKSHEGLSPEEKKVLVQQYLSTIKPSKIQEMLGEKPTSTDEYLKNLADEKEKLNNKFLNIIRSGQVG